MALSRNDDDGPSTAGLPYTEAVCTQVEWYFSDDSLPHDAFMLGLTGGNENWPVNLSRICNFPKMKQHKPPTRIREALRSSTVLEFFPDEKHIRRRIPLTIEPTVEPELIPGKTGPAEPKQPRQNAGQQANAPIAQLPKGMLKPTGFEEYFADAPVTPGDFETEQELYSRDILFETRIETAIQRYYNKRKFHSDASLIFEKFLSYGGIDCGPRQFTGGYSKEEFESMDAHQIAAATARHRVAEHVEHDDKWTVDFAGVARGFLSYETISKYLSGSSAEVEAYTNIMSNFYRYLLHHNVCPEHNGQIRDALEVCRTAAVELKKAVELCGRLRGPFDEVCSALDQDTGGDSVQRSDDDWAPAPPLINRAHGEEYVRAVAGPNHSHAERPTERDVKLQVVDIKFPEESDRQKILQSQKNNAQFRAVGRLICQEMNGPLTKPLKNAALVLLWVDEEVLGLCFTGMKIEATIRQKGEGLTWIERVLYVNASYFEVLANEFYDRKREAALPKRYYDYLRNIKKYGYEQVHQRKTAPQVDEQDVMSEQGDGIDGIIDAGDETGGL